MPMPTLFIPTPEEHALLLDLLKSEIRRSNLAVIAAEMEVSRSRNLPCGDQDHVVATLDALRDDHERLTQLLVRMAPPLPLVAVIENVLYRAGLRQVSHPKLGGTVWSLEEITASAQASLEAAKNRTTTLALPGL